MTCPYCGEPILVESVPCPCFTDEFEPNYYEDSEEFSRTDPIFYSEHGLEDSLEE